MLLKHDEYTFDVTSRFDTFWLCRSEGLGEEGSDDGLMGEFSRFGLIRNTSNAQEAQEAQGAKEAQSKAGWEIKN